MSRTSNALARALEEIGTRQTEFAARCGIQLSQINRFVRGNVEIGAASLETIARQLPETQRARVVAAWLLDHIPSTASGLVSILDNVTARISEAPAPAGDLAPELAAAVEYLTQAARTHTEISDLLIDLARALRGHSP